MKKLQYESPELDIRWFELEDIISYSVLYDDIGGDHVTDEDFSDEDIWMP